MNKLFSVKIKLSHSNFFLENSLAIAIKKTQILMHKHVYSGLSVLEISKIVMHQFRYDYLKPKYREKTELC